MELRLGLLRIIQFMCIIRLTQNWSQLDATPGYRGDKGEGTAFPIFLPFWDKRIERRPWLQLWRKAFERLSNVEALCEFPLTLLI